MVRSLKRQLIILSPYAKLASVVRILAESRQNHVVCSFLLLPSERARLVAADPAVRIETMREYATDTELAQLDESVHSALLRAGIDSGAEDLLRLDHTRLYIKGIKRERNRLVATKIWAADGRPDRLWICSGPNVDLGAWLEVFRGVEYAEMSPIAFPEPAHEPGLTAGAGGTRNGNLAVTSIAGLRRTRYFDGPKATVGLLELPALRIGLKRRLLRNVFAGSKFLRLLRRVRGQQRRLRQHLQLQPNSITSEAYGVTTWTMLLRLFANILLILDARRQGARALLTSMHSFSAMQAWAAKQVGMPVFVFQDGYLPVNYPGSLYWQYTRCQIFFWSQSCSKWGEAAGLHGYVISPKFSQTLNPTSHTPHRQLVTRILALMNHGGEWTSLISRCDIDLFASGIVEVARRMPLCEFWLRPHPTGRDNAHDGFNCVDRLKRLIRESGLTNVRISEQQLSTDLGWAEYVVTEYSLTLLEYVAANYGGVAIYNPTQRRNFPAVSEFVTSR